MKILRAYNKSTGTILAEHIECADGPFSRLIGLLGRTDLDAGGGMWILPSSGVHTFGMSFTIDVVGLDAKMRVVKLRSHMRPFRVSSVSLQVRSVLELAAGEIHVRALKIGHQVELLP